MAGRSRKLTIVQTCMAVIARMQPFPGRVFCAGKPKQDPPETAPPERYDGVPSTFTFSPGPALRSRSSRSNALVYSRAAPTW